MYPHSIAAYAQAFDWLILMAVYFVLFGVGHWIGEVVHRGRNSAFFSPNERVITAHKSCAEMRHAV